MDFLKKHYEKIILIAVLAALALAVAWLPLAIAQAKRDITDDPIRIPENPPRVEREDPEMYRQQLAPLTNPPALRLIETHRLFNPVVWKRKPDGELLKVATGDEEGPAALQLTKPPTPLRLIVRYDRFNPGDGHYTFTVTRENHPRLRTPSQRRGREGSINDVFTLREVVGSPEAPAEFVIELADTKETLRFTPQQPLERIEAYTAELRYPPTNQTFPNLRVRSRISFGGETYNVVDITEDAVRVLAVSNQKPTTIRLKNDVP